jgi:hypothetical protein
VYLWPFSEAVRAGVAAVMCSYNTVGFHPLPLVKYANIVGRLMVRLVLLSGESLLANFGRNIRLFELEASQWCLEG